MSLLNLRDITFTWSGPTLLDGVDLDIKRGERVGLVGRNGAGKSTLMKIIAGEVKPDHGVITLASGASIARLVQEVPPADEASIAEIVAQGMDSEEEPWVVDQAVEKVLSKLKLPGDIAFATLSSGMKRRVLLAQALVSEPDILLLDEPTNHLDIDSITWLESFLSGYSGTLIFVTHDRVFLQALANRIVEVERGRLFDWTCDYQTFLERKKAALEAEEKQQAHFDKKLAQEEVWIRQGIKARRTRNEGRVRALKKMREERSQRREKLGNVRMQAMEADRSGERVIDFKDVSFAYDDRPIIKDLTTLITRGDKIGIVGPNGAGKSTLLKLLLGQLKPSDGYVKLGTKLEIVYFDQLREQIDEEKSIAENVGEGQDRLTFNGKQKHIYGYLQEFLFTPERARQQAKFLSGGERNRLLLARLFKRPSNLLVLDEPTNDLDAETLELLEELVVDYKGTLLLVSHDRAFLNNVVTSTLVLEGDGVVKEYDGGYDDYLRQRPKMAASNSESTAKSKRKGTGLKPVEAPKAKAKLSYKEKQELDALPEKIESLEQEQGNLHETMADPDFFKQDGDEIAAATGRLEKIQAELEELMSRWEELESRNS